MFEYKERDSHYSGILDRVVPSADQHNRRVWAFAARHRDP